MDVFILGGTMVELVIWMGILLIGIRLFQKKPPALNIPLDWPRISVVVPVNGMSAETKDAVTSLCNQGYDKYEILFALLNQKDPAAGFIQSCVERTPHARMVYAGHARSCGQKNHNLLAALKKTDPGTEVYVFCDSGHVAPPNFLKYLVYPIVRGGMDVTSGYHQVVPVGDTIPGVCRALTVLMLYITKDVPFLNQPWGGATAIRKKLFNKLAVAELWKSVVVDDVSLARLLAENKIKTGLAMGAVLATPPVSESYGSWIQWLTRQWSYFRMYFPGGWIISGLVFYLLTFLVFFHLVAFAGGLLGLISPFRLLVSAFTLAVTIVYIFILRKAHPHPPAPLLWFAGAITAIFLLPWSHLCSLEWRTFRWKGIRYRMGKKGRVIRVIHE